MTVPSPVLPLIPDAPSPLAHYSGLPFGAAPLRLVFAHGWGMDHRAFLPLAASFTTEAGLALLDLPGFGGAPLPPEDWGVQDYAHAMASFIEKSGGGPVVWVGHSFGGRVGIALAALRPDLVSRLVLIASAGLKPKRPWPQAALVFLKIRVYKAMKAVWQSLGLDLEPLKARFGSADYRHAGPMRRVLVRTVSEDLSSLARRVARPTLLLYGAADRETPPDLGARLAALIPQSQFHILPNFDHHTILTAGRHQVLERMRDFLRA